MRLPWPPARAATGLDAPAGVALAGMGSSNFAIDSRDSLAGSAASARSARGRVGFHFKLALASAGRPLIDPQLRSGASREKASHRPGGARNSGSGSSAAHA